MRETLAFGPPVVTVDVEDWPQSTWDRSLPITARAAANTCRVLDVLQRTGVRSTMFVLGKFAEAFPEIVKEIDRQGHEVACHGYGHVEIFRQTPDEFRADITRAKDVIEGIVGHRVAGYRAPDFSLVHDTMWALPIIAEAGFAYDSSIYPVRAARYGIHDWPAHPLFLDVAGTRLLELPVASLARWGKKWPVGGGGYHRLLPGWLTRLCAREVMKAYPFVLYCHPYEFDHAEFRNLGLKIPASVRLHQGFGRRWFESRFTGFVQRFGGRTAGELLTACTWPVRHLALPAPAPVRV